MEVLAWASQTLGPSGEFAPGGVGLRFNSGDFSSLLTTNPEYESGARRILCGWEGGQGPMRTMSPALMVPLVGS